jgi:hypothetical protein
MGRVTELVHVTERDTWLEAATAGEMATASN